MEFGVKINNQYLLTFVYEKTLNCLKSYKSKWIKINMQYYLNDKKLNKIEKQKAEKDEVQTSSFFFILLYKY